MTEIKGLFTFLFFMVFQSLSWWHPYLKISRSDLLKNMVLGAFNGGTLALVFFCFRELSLPVMNEEPLIGGRALLYVILFDGLSYAWHRANHHFDFLWTWHKLHHQESVIETSSAFRFHPLEVFLSLGPKMFLLWVLNGRWSDLIVFEVIFMVSNLFQHSNFHIPPWLDRPLGVLITTPSYHRRHHSILAKDQRTNFGTILTLWDRLFFSQALNTSDSVVEMGLSR